MKFQKTTFLLLITTLLFGSISAQDLTQNIRGRITDLDSKAALPGANIVVLGTDPLIGTTSDIDGFYLLKDVPVGRHDLLIKFLGYKEKYISNIVINSKKEIQLEIELEESIEKLDEVVVKPGKESAESLNEMSLVSARVISVEETKRSPGTFNDPARMASTYAGVTSDPEGDNSIIVRGNSPKGIQWRLEGIEIPNPNHFSDEGTSGGPINVLNSDMLSNSSFHTGAFAPEYGNAYSGIMDLQLRTGNKGKPEFSISMGALGLEASAEGPFKKESNSSYLVNYRYSTLTLLNKIGLVDYGGVPEYQDGLFKIHVPTKKAGIFTLFGLGGYSHIDQDFTRSDGEVYSHSKYKSWMGATAIKHAYPINDKTYISTNLSFSLKGDATDADHINDDEDSFYKSYADDMNRNVTGLASSVTHKFNARHIIKTGAGLSIYNFNYKMGWHEDEIDDFVTKLNTKGVSGAINTYVSWKYRILDNLTMVNGLHYQQFLLNNSYSIEPRSSLKWNFRSDQSVYAGIGLHSRMESISQYYSIHYDDEGNESTPNKNMELAKSAHFIAGYQNSLTPNLNLKIEAYYQHLYDVPVEDDPKQFLFIIKLIGLFHRRQASQ